MYDVTYDIPKILVNGADDSSGIVSHLVYDKDTHTLTFNVSHFTTFQAIEDTSTGKAPVSEVRGRLFCDVNGNSVWDAETEYPLRHITVLITDLSSDTTHYRETDDTGTYTLGTQGSGKYRVLPDTHDPDNTCGTYVTTESKDGSLTQFIDALSQQIIYAKDIGLTHNPPSSAPSSAPSSSSYPGMPKTGRG